MQMKSKNKKITSHVLGLLLIMTMAVVAIGCGKSNPENGNQSSVGTQSTEETRNTLLGEGKVQFTFTVVDKDSNEAVFEIHTDREMVGDALLELELIEGEESEFGLFVKKVNGITADYDVDQTYWAFYINGEYATSGVSTTPVEEGATYTYKVEK